ncbi:MAG: RNA methyltransferase, partial [Clostridia bacterium]|nr:RNA methyltransferase [Clostridia bacterium]
MPRIYEITDFSAPELDPYSRLTENQLVNREHPEQGMFIAESALVIERALDAGCVPISFLTERRYLETRAKHLIKRCGEIPVY